MENAVKKLATNSSVAFKFKNVESFTGFDTTTTGTTTTTIPSTRCTPTSETCPTGLK